MHVNITKDVDKSKIDKWKYDMAKKEIAYLEIMTKKNLEIFGYELTRINIFRFQFILLHLKYSLYYFIFLIIQKCRNIYHQNFSYLE